MVSFYLPKPPIWNKVLCKEFPTCQVDKTFPHQKQTAEKHDFKRQSLFFNHQISFDTNVPISPSSERNSYVLVVIDDFTIYAALNPVLHHNAYYAYAKLNEHWISKLGFSEIFVTVDDSEVISNQVITLCHINNIKHKARTLLAQRKN